MSEVKRYHVTETGLVEGESLGRLSVVLSSDFDTLQSRLDDTERQRRAEFDAGQAAERLVAELQQRLTAADELADTMEGLLRLARGAIGENKWTLLTKDIDTMLSQDAQRTNNSRNAHCPHDGICHTSEETCADAQERIASLTAPAGAGQ